MALPIFKDSNQSLMLLQTNWKSQLDPVLANPFTNLSILKSINLSTGVNVINHKLGRMQQGWILTDMNAGVTVYRSAPFNNLTLQLTASGAVTVSIGVY